MIILLLSLSTLCRFLNQNGYRASEMLAETEEDNPDDLYATYALLHTYRSEYVNDYISILFKAPQYC